MSKHEVGSTANSNDAVSGPSARRKFLRQSGRVAIAAPAVVLLLSAGSRGAYAQAVGGYNGSPTKPPETID
jgi:hypothetical protein